MKSVRARAVVGASGRGGLVMRQVPVDLRPGYITELTYALASGTVAFRTIATNATTVGSYASGTEYWYTRHETLGSSLSLATSASTYTAQQLDQFHADCSTAFSWTQNIGTGGWTQGTYTPTATRTATLYKAVDPDNANAWIGLLLEQHKRTKALERTVWYKTSNTGTIWATTPAALSFSQVLDGAGAPSTNPNDITSTTWYYAAS